MNFMVGLMRINEKMTMAIAVPRAWENEGIVYYPQHLTPSETNELIKDPLSLPDKDIWIKRDFTFKGSAATYRLADMMAHSPKLFGEEVKMIKIAPKIEGFQPDSIEFSSNSNERQTQRNNIDFYSDDEFYQKSIKAVCDHNNQLNDLDMRISQCIDQNTETHLKLDGFRKTLDLLLHKFGMKAGLLFDDFKSIEDYGEHTLNTSSSVLSKWDLVDGKISKCILSNELTHLKMDKLQKSLDTILKNVANMLIESEATAEAPASDKEETEMYNFPISSVSELNKLDRELEHNAMLMSQLVSKFTKIAGDSGNKLVSKVGVKIVESIISANLLTKFTWTGRTTGMKCEKLPFMIYTSIFNLCLRVISKADRSFDRNECEIFLKNNILKHSSIRLSRKFAIKVYPRKINNGNWCSESRITIDPSAIQSIESSGQTVFPNSNVHQQKSDTEEVASDEEIIDSKEHIMNFIDDQKEIKNNLQVEEESNNFCSPTKCEPESKLNEMDRKISHCIDSNTNVHLKIDEMQKTLNLILSRIEKVSGFETNDVPDPFPDPQTTNDELDSFNFPLTAVTDLIDLNKKLATSENFEKKMINKFIGVVRDVKKMSVQRYGLEIVERVISSQLLLKYSWTGLSKANKPKLAFMKYKAIISFFQKVLSKADDRFTRKECEDFLRFSVLKHINLRVARKQRKMKKPICDYLSDHDTDPSSVSQTINDELDSFNFPLTAVVDLIDLNKKLATSENFEKKMINKFIGVARDVKKMSIQRYGLEIVERVISSQLLIKYSWTGLSTANKPKLAFMKYKAIISFFQKVISNTDDCFTRKECENFLRFSVLKHINLRVARKQRKKKEPICDYLSDHDIKQDIKENIFTYEDIPMPMDTLEPRREEC